MTEIRKSVKYKIWKQPIYKWDSWVANRRRRIKVIDDWSQYIVDNCKGKTVVYDSGGIFFSDFIQDLTVVEYTPCPVLDIKGVQFVKNGATFDAEFDNLIMINPLSTKLDSSLVRGLSVPGICRHGKKPAVLEWLKRPAKIFLSMADWNMYFNRLRYSVEEYVDLQIEELKSIGVECEYKSIEPVHNDIENGNIKLVLSVQKSV